MLLDIFSRIGHPKQVKNGYRIGRDATTVETGVQQVAVEIAKGEEDKI